MREADLGAVLAIAAEVHPAYPERREVFEDKRRLFPQGCFVLEAPDGIDGYALGHPWRTGQPAPLDALLGSLPEPAGTFWIHDVALLPRARGAGAASAVVALLLALARERGVPTASLVSVHGSSGFWRRHGFREVPAASLSTKALARMIDTYGDAALLMEAPLTASAGGA